MLCVSLSWHQGSSDLSGSLLASCDVWCGDIFGVLWVVRTELSWFRLILVYLLGTESDIDVLIGGVYQNSSYTDVRTKAKNYSVD